MPTPTSVRLGALQKKLTSISRRTGLKQPDMVKLALEEFFARHRKDDEIKEAVIRYRIEGSK
jgi:hypothetical protein